jgi:hypothetical protein
MVNRNASVYRKIWEQYYGEIPKDENGKSYDIHHIDGNRNNNDISNLKAVSIKEHYEIHKNQGDWRAAHMLSIRLHLTKDELDFISKKMAESKRGKKQSKQAIEKRSKIFSGQGNPMFGKKHSQETIELIRKSRTGKGLGPKSWVKGNWTPKYGKDNTASRRVTQHDLQGNFIQIYETIQDAMKITGANNISKACRGLIKSSGGYIWKYF